jgi:hypothetical protein
MKIEKIETHVCHARMRNWVFVKVITDQPGLYGWGEATLEWHTRSVVGAVEDIAPLIIGEERLINTVANVTTHRTNRITVSIETLPSLLVQLLSILSLFMVTACSLIPIDETAFKLLLTVANSFGIAFAYFVILDLDYPFRGVWSLQPRPFEQFIKRHEASQS